MLTVQFVGGIVEIILVFETHRCACELEPGCQRSSAQHPSAATFHHGCRDEKLGISSPPLATGAFRVSQEERQSIFAMQQSCLFYPTLPRSKCHQGRNNIDVHRAASVTGRRGSVLQTSDLQTLGYEDMPQLRWIIDGHEEEHHEHEDQLRISTSRLGRFSCRTKPAPLDTEGTCPGAHKVPNSSGRGDNQRKKG